MFRVWKYTLDHGTNNLMMPRNPKFLHLGEQHGTIMMWALVDTHAAMQSVQVDVVQTGEEAPNANGGMHIGTVTARTMVFHGFWIR